MTFLVVVGDVVDNDVADIVAEVVDDADDDVGRG